MILFASNDKRLNKHTRQSPSTNRVEARVGDCAAATVGDRDGVRVRFRRTQQDHGHDRQHPHTHALKQWLVVFNGVLIKMVLFVITKYLVNNFITYFWRQQKQTPLAQLELLLELF